MNVLQPLDDKTSRDKHFDIFTIVVLLAFGAYHSVLLFGYQVVPNPDFTNFVRTGHELLSFQLPSSWKQAPVLGLLQASLSYLVGGETPDLTAGWLLNALLHPLNVVLLWLVGRQIVGSSAVWVTLIAIINPWVTYLVAEPIAETTLLFFVLISFYLIFKRSRWSYLFSSIATMVRYEGAALILVAFVVDISTCRTPRERLLAFVRSGAALVPLLLWILGTMIYWQSQDTHYLKEIGATSHGKIVLIEYMRLLWLVGFYPLFAAGESSGIAILAFSKTLVAIVFIFGVIYALSNRHRNILVLLIFFVPYIIVHAVHAFVIPRLCATVYWIPLFICVYGLQNCWKLIVKKSGLSHDMVRVLQGVALTVAFVWFVSVTPYLHEWAGQSPKLSSLPYVAVGVVALLFGAKGLLHKGKSLLPDYAVAVFVCFLIVSNQSVLASVVGDGKRDIEFKLLADWYVASAQRGEKMVSTMSNILEIFAPDHKGNFVHMATMKAGNPSEFIRDCYRKDITYVAWDSRLGYARGLAIGGLYYKLWGMDSTAMLDKTRSIGPYEFITQIGRGKRFINVFHLRGSQHNGPGVGMKL